MWRWTDGTGELYHYGIKGMKWGVRKARVTRSKNGRATTNSNHAVIDAYKSERKRQRKYLTVKRAVLVGQSMANQYLQSHNVLLNGKPLRVNSTAVAVVNSILNLKYTKDTFK